MFILDLCKALKKEKIQYAIVGGYAVALHGAVRGTIDIDLVISLDEKSFIKTEELLKGLGLQPRLPVSAKQVFQFREEYIQNRHLIAWSFHDVNRPIKQVDIIITHDFKKMKAAVIELHGVKISVASIESLIEMKKKSARPQDLEDVKSLLEIQKNGKA